MSSGNQYILMSDHVIKEGTELNLIKVKDRKSQNNLADIFTKNVAQGVITRLLDQLCGYELVDFMAME